MSKKIKVAVLMGGNSSERKISLLTGKEAMAHFGKEFLAKAYDAKTDLDALVKAYKAKKIDVVFNALHGAEGEDGKIQGFLDTNRIPYTGSGALSSAMAFDKAITKRIYCANAIPTPKALRVTREQWKKHKSSVLKSIKRKLGKKIAVKPNASGSSVGVTVLPKEKEVVKAIQKAFQEDKESIIIEKAVRGRELTVGILEQETGLLALPVIEICPSNDFFDYKAKYSGKSREICPALMPDCIARFAQDMALHAHESLRCRGYSRTDFMWCRDQVYALETNTLPGLTKTSLFPQAAEVAGVTFSDLLSKLIKRALK